MPRFNEEQIKETVVNDPAKAVRMIVDSYGSRLYWHIRRLVVVHDDADEALQNTFINAWKNLGGFRSESSLYTWLYTIATNEALSLIRKRERQRGIPLESLGDYFADTTEGDSWFDGDEAEAKLQDAIIRLPEKQRLVFNMKYYDDLTYEEMSGILGTSVGALKASYHHAVKKLEQYLTS